MDFFDMKGLLIATLCFAVPVVTGVLNKRTKAKRKTPQVKAEPIDFEAFERSKQAAERSAPAAQEVPEVHTAPPVQVAPAPPAAPAVRSAPAAQTVPAVQRPLAKSAAPPAGRAAAANPHKGGTSSSRRQEDSSWQFPTAEEIRQDRKKLILYSEILKPKFDER